MYIFTSVPISRSIGPFPFCILLYTQLVKKKKILVFNSRGEYKFVEWKKKEWLHWNVSYLKGSLPLRYFILKIFTLPYFLFFYFLNYSLGLKKICRLLNLNIPTPSMDKLYYYIFCSHLFDTDTKENPHG